MFALRMVLRCLLWPLLWHPERIPATAFTWPVHGRWRRHGVGLRRGVLQWTQRRFGNVGAHLFGHGSRSRRCRRCGGGQICPLHLRRGCRRWLNLVGRATKQVHHPIAHAANGITNEAVFLLVNELAIHVNLLQADRLLEHLRHDGQRTVRALPPVVATQRDAAIVEANPRTGHHIRMT